MNADTIDYEALERVWSEAVADYVKVPKWSQRWCVTTEMPNRPNGLAASSDDMYATRKEAVNKCRKALLRGIESLEGNIRRYVKALERLGE